MTQPGEENWSSRLVVGKRHVATVQAGFHEPIHWYSVSCTLTYEKETIPAQLKKIKKNKTLNIKTVQVIFMH